MNQRSIGMQWRLAAIYLAVSILSSGAMAVGYSLATYAGIPGGEALWVGIAAGLLAGLCGAAFGFVTARDMKRRLWDAGDLATRIAKGDLDVKLEVGAADEIGQLEEQLNRMAQQLQAAVKELRRLAEQNRALAEEAGRGAALEERARLARDLHDTVNQQLFVLTMRSAAARKRLDQLGGEAAALVPELSGLEELARQAHAETRSLILQLRPTMLEQQGLGPALAEYVQASGGKENWQVKLEIDPAVRLTGVLAEGLFRVAQEALNNISKHAEAQTVWVTLSVLDGEACLTIRDDGKGFDMRSNVSPTAVGLVGMQERMAALGGTVKVRSYPEAGTELVAAIPVAQPVSIPAATQD